MIRWGLIKGLAAVGGRMGLYSAKPSFKRENHARTFADAERAFDRKVCQFWTLQPNQGHEARQAMAAALDEFRPDVVLAWGCEATLLYRSTGAAIPCGIMSIDLEFMPRLYHTYYRLIYGDIHERIAAAHVLRPTLWNAWLAYREMKKAYPLADFVINHAANHLAWHRRQWGLPSLYTPNPVVTLDQRAPEKAPSGFQSRFYLLGSNRSTATLTGHIFFAFRVLPHLKSALAAGTISLEIVGVDLLPPFLNRAYDLPGITRSVVPEEGRNDFFGYCAMIVPTPMPLGFRTRILDAFRYGQTVISHAANAAGMPELIHDRNALVARNGHEFAEHMLALGDDPERRERLAQQAYQDFINDLSAEASAKKIYDFLSDFLNLNRTS